MNPSDVVDIIAKLASAKNKDPKRLGSRARVYLACPYKCKGIVNETWEQLRFDCVNIAAMRLIRAGFVVFSPISHSHPISLTQPDKYNTHELWLDQDEPFLEWCDVVVVLEIPGVWDSHGVDWERSWAFEHDKPQVVLTLNDIYQMEKGETK